MIEHAVLTAIGADRPGLVDEVSQLVFQHGGNIEDSRMVNLRGQFAMMILVSGATDRLARIREGLADLAERTHLHLELHPAEPITRAPAAASALPYRLTASAMDQSGLVHRVARVLREMRINIESLETQLRPAPITGAPVFEMELALAVPGDVPVAQLRKRLGGLCDELNIDWQLTAL